MRALAAASSWLIAGVAYLVLEATAAGAFSGYSYAHDYISDLGRQDSPLSAAMNTAFVLQGTGFLLGAVLIAFGARSRTAGLFVAFAAANAIGNVLVAAVPSGTGRLHVVGAALAIVGGNAAIAAGASFVLQRRWYRRLSSGLAALGLVSLLLVALGSGATWERVSVYTIIGWQLLSAVCLVVTSAGAARSTRR